ncbi:MAG: 1-acyl-sn-glycerol-3-phosphate acyltransferase [Neolewinella sp.]|jgi:1-acyl-sn-glycerol-3-phosphate acyltransferase
MKQFIGNLIFVIGQIASTAVFVPFVLVVTPFLSSVKKGAFIGLWARFIIWWLEVCCHITYRITGQENIPEGPAIILSNHQSAWETIAFQRIFPVHSQLLKRELLWIPFFGWGLAANQPIAIDRSKKTQAMQQLVRQGKDRLAAGRWISIFPEGTRLPVGQPGDYQAGGAFIACKAGALVVPVAHNAGAFWPKKHPFSKHAGVVDVVIGEVIDATGMKPRELNSQVEGWIKRVCEGLAKEA